MYLKSLEIHGFKSFADKTVLEFAKGVTGIVGPNGCGKSNVVDAIRWVLGETSAKALRGGEMADVIFNGTEKRKPLGMAEVTLTMADCEAALKVDFNEVALTRRVFRDGKSEYRINGTLCRLKDIHDLLMDTGIGRTAYSIMAQGQIDQILSSKPEERRAVFEEAAGITKFKKEKKEALRKLEFTEANLLRVSDVLAEQDRRMNSLRRQVAKARRYQSLAADVRVLDTHLGHRKFTKLSSERSALIESIRILEVRDTELERMLPMREESVAEARSAARALDGELTELRHRYNEHRNALSSSRGRISFNQERAAELESRIRQNHEDIHSTREKLAQQEFDFIAAHDALTQVLQKIAEQEIQVASQEERVAVTRASREAIEAALRESRSEATRCQTAIATMQARIENALAQMEGTRSKARQLAEDEHRLQSELETLELRRQDAIAEMDQTTSEIAALEQRFLEADQACLRLRSELDVARQQAQQASQVFAKRAARHQAVRQLLESGEGFEKGTRSVLDGLGQPDRYKPLVAGPLASFLQADPSCARAIEKVLGQQLQSVLVRDQSAAEEIIARLTEKQLGVASLLPETFVPTAPCVRQPLPQGATAWAVDVVQADPRVAGTVFKLLAEVLIAPNLSTALRLRVECPEATIVTLAGVMIHRAGMLTGGDSAEGATSLLEMSNEVRALEKEVSVLQVADEAARKHSTQLETQLEELRNNAESCRERLQHQKVVQSTCQGALSLASREVENHQTRLDALTRERDELEQRESSVTHQREDLESDLSMARERLDAIETESRRLQCEADDAVRIDQDLNATLNELRTELAVERRAKQSAEEQQKPMEARLHELREVSIRRETEIETFQQRIEAAIAENARLAEDAETHELEMQDLQQEIDSRSEGRAGLLQAIEDSEADLDEIRRDHARINEQKGREEVASTKVELQLQHLVSGIQERYQVELAEFLPDRAALIASIASQREMLSGGGRQSFVTPEDDEPDATRAYASDSAEEDIEDIEDDVAADDSEDDEPPIMVVDATRDEPEARANPNAEPDWDFVESAVADIRRRLDSMGPVNTDAIQEFEELEERYNFLRSQHDDLVSSKSELLTVIDRINAETQRLFSETFAQVRVNFQVMFKELFGEKGQADLTLLDESDPLESGIEVIAKPPGKKLQSITLLSGGERSMTAVALLFSIYMIKPSPFCVLDELDAPLDESNINRFVKVLDRFIDRSQFIIVTHSKRTMARADVMYGVTMEEFGVSKPVGMRLTQDDGSKIPTDARTAAQKAALRLDA